MRPALLALLATAPAAIACFAQPPGYARLLQAYGDKLPDGRGVAVAQVEPPAPLIGDAKDSTRRSHIPARDRAEFAGVRFGNVAPDALDGSAHSTGTATRFYGRTGSASPGVEQVDLFTANAFLRQLTAPKKLGSAQVWNHSWVGGIGAQDPAVLKAFDRAAAQRGWVAVAGVKNKGTNPPLLSAAFNVLSVGRSDGGHALGAANRGAPYGPGRHRPHLVASGTHTSATAPMVSSVAALLLDRLSTHNAAPTSAPARARVVRAALMAGAAREFARAEGAPVGYAAAGARTANGLDRRYGAGQLDAWTSYHIVDAILASEDGLRPARGFAVAGWVGEDTAEASRYALAPLSHGTLSVALIWDYSPARRDMPADLKLTLYDETDKRVAVAMADGRVDTGEHLYVEVRPERAYVLEVSAAQSGDKFTPYALAWAHRPRG